MVLRAKIGVLAAGCSLMFASCYHHYTQVCEEAYLTFQFAGFSRPELDTLILTTYPGGTQFAAPDRIDTASGAALEQVGDTLRFESSSEPWQLRAGSDYELFMPSTGKRIRISTITLEGEETRTHRETWGTTYERILCVNAITSYELDVTRVAVSMPEEVRGALVTITR